jgi:hypothetical protein
MLFKIVVILVYFLIKLVIFTLLPIQAWAFPYIPDSLKPLSELEKELQKLSAIITTDPSMESRLQANQDFRNKLLALLKRPDSYDYPFDSLPLVSRLYPKDQSFRIFTWTVQVIEVDTQYKKLKVRINNQFFGIVQRKLKIKKDIEKILVLPLLDNSPKNEALQNQLLDAQRWLGALYYHPRNSLYGILTYYGKYRKFINNKKSKIISIPYYVALGWNQEGGEANFKIIEVITFDSKDSSKIYFGAPLFYTSPIPAYRMIFKYSPNAPFSLNLGLVKTGPFNSKRKMIVFDHLVMPKHTRPQSHYEGGPDGTYDAFCYINRVVDERKGFFLLMRNVNVYDPAMDRYKESVIKKQLREERRRLKKILKN